MKNACKVGDIGTAHEGFPPTPIVSGSNDVFIDNLPAARVGDILAPHAKPKHPPHPRQISTGASAVFINNKPAALTGGKVSCGGVTIGTGTVFIGDEIPASVSIPIYNEVKRVTAIYFSYGLEREKLSNKSRHYSDINIHVTTEGYSAGESVTINLDGVISKSVTGKIDGKGEAFIEAIFERDILEFEGEV